MIVRAQHLQWNVYAQHGCCEEAFETFRQMQGVSTKPQCVLNACACPTALEEVHAHIVDVRVGNALINMYAKSGSIRYAWLVFDKLDNGDVISWTAMIVGLC